MTDTEIIAGVGNEVFYFFVMLVLLVVVGLAWYSTAVVEPVVQSVILVERSPVAGLSQEEAAQSAGLQPNTAEQVRQAVTQFLQQEAEPPQPDQQVEPGPSLGPGIPADTHAHVPDSVEREEVGLLEQEGQETERVTVRLKFLNDTQKEVAASLTENIGQFKRRNFSEEISSNKNVRLIFNGQVLRDEETSLRNYGIFDKCVVHCLIQQGGAGQAGTGQPASHGHTHSHAHLRRDPAHHLDLSAYFIPMLGLLLAGLWYLALAYSAYFNLLSTTALIGLTSLYFLSVYGTHFHVTVRTGVAAPPADQ